MYRAPKRHLLCSNRRVLNQPVNSAEHAIERSEADGLADALRELVTGLCATSDSACAEGDALQVVCEVVLHGERFVLLRGPALDPVEMLSPREREILWLICDGKSNLAIARVLEISPWTVSSYLRRIFAKLGVSTRAGAVALVLSRHPGHPTPHASLRPRARLNAAGDR